MIDHPYQLVDRLKRYVSVTKIIGSTAAKCLGEKLTGIKVDHRHQAQLLTKTLGNLKGPIVKVAQFLATIPDALPQEYLYELQSLQSQAPAMSWLFVKQRMSKELGENWLDKFASFSQQASAASIGQVHKATDHSGQKLACKLQYPNMVEVMTADLNQLKAFFKIYESIFKALATEEIFNELAEHLYEELNYQTEANNIRIYQQIFAKDLSIHVPRVNAELSTKRLLTMTWLDGYSLTQVLDYPLEIRNKLASSLFKTWYLPFYKYGFIHADPHPGNYSFAGDQGVNLLDFGCIRRFNSTFVEGAINLYKAFLHNRPDQEVFAYQQLGFGVLSKQLIKTLNLWARLLYEPLLEDRIRSIQPDNRGLRGRNLAVQVHHELRRLGGVKVPREFVFMDRAAVGIGAAFMRLQAKQNWYRLFQDLIEGFEVTSLEQHQQQLIN